MRTLFLLLAAVVLSLSDAAAQPVQSFAFRPTVHNYCAPLREGRSSFSDVVRKQSGFGVELTYYRRLLPNTLLGVPVRIGTAQTDCERGNPNERAWLAHVDVLAQQHFFKPSARVQPYAQIGMGSGYTLEQKSLVLQFPMGVGLNVRLTSNLYLTAQTQHRFSDDNRDAWHHALGLQFNFGKALTPRAKAKPQELPTAPADRDGDGVADIDDRCPDAPGPSETNGCPDRDGDGVADREDRCPNEPGSPALSGCPDRDGDGVADGDDRCPDKPGLASNFGCSEVSAADLEILNAAMRNVQFATNSANLLPSSHAVLDQVADLMARYPEYRLFISGHTDSVGDDKFNLDLSRRRAKACRDYLVVKGVPAERIEYEGYGETRPIAPNDTEAGRAKNRRVEFELRLR